MSYTTLLAQVHDFTVGLPPAAWILARCLAPVKDARFARAAARWASPILDGVETTRGSEFGRGGETASSTELGNMSSAEVVAQMVVPNAPPGTNINCTSCANAVYDCLTGLNADATAGDNTGCGNQFSLEAAHFSNSGTVSEVTDYMESLGSGQTRIVTIQTGPNTSRALDVTNQNGTVYFIDGQSGQIVTPSPGVGIRLGYPSYNDPPVPWDK